MSRMKFSLIINIATTKRKNFLSYTIPTLIITTAWGANQKSAFTLQIISHKECCNFVKSLLIMMDVKESHCVMSQKGAFEEFIIEKLLWWYNDEIWMKEVSNVWCHRDYYLTLIRFSLLIALKMGGSVFELNLNFF